MDKIFIELTECSGGNTRKIFVNVENICRLCECRTIYTIDGEKFFVNEPIEDIIKLINRTKM